MSALQKFKEAWTHPDYPPDPVSKVELAALENELCIEFPEDYRESIVAVGAISPTGAFMDWLDKSNEKIMADLGLDLDLILQIAQGDTGKISSAELDKHLSTLQLVDELELHDINEFYTPAQIRSSLNWIDLGMPKNMVPIASDSFGNPFAFLREDLSESNPKAAIYTWDHDFPDDEMVCIANSFEKWIAKHLPKPDDTAPESS